MYYSPLSLDLLRAQSSNNCRYYPESLEKPVNNFDCSHLDVTSNQSDKIMSSNSPRMGLYDYH